MALTLNLKIMIALSAADDVRIFLFNIMCDVDFIVGPEFIKIFSMSNFNSGVI
jgi:hypothetical protein